MNLAWIKALLVEQDGVISRRQVLACAGDDAFIERMLRRKEWARVHRGIFVNHTGPLTQRQREWAAVLYYQPAALTHQTALEIAGVRLAGAGDGLVHVAVHEDRRVHDIEEVRVHHIAHLGMLVQPNRSPARLRVEHALLRLASSARSEADAIALLADACQARRTTASRLLVALELHPRLKRRRFLADVLRDVAQGVHSVLEHRYLTRVERPHGLPTGRRQRHVSPGRLPAFRDVEYLEFGLVVELDGRLGHEGTLRHWDDLDRDIAGAVAGDLTVRAGWRQVQENCRLAIAVARLLTARGWSGRLHPCSAECPAHDVAEVSGVVPAPGTESAPETGADPRARPA